MALNSHVQEKHAQMKRWSLARARLSQSIGAEYLAKAGPWLVASHICKSARADVEKASEQYSTAYGSGASESLLSELTARHVSALAKYQDAQDVLCQLQQKKRFSPDRVAALRPYLEAEEEHCAQMAEINSKTRQSAEDLADAKGRYRKALRCLEELSEETHRRRGSSM